VVLTEEGEKEVEHMRGQTSRLKSIAGYAAKVLSVKLLKKICAHTQASGHRDKTKGIIIGLIITEKINRKACGFKDGGLSEQPALSNKVLAAFTRVINSLRIPEIKELCKNFNQQPSKDVLTAGKSANQELCEKIKEAVNNEETDETGEDECDVNFFQCEHESCPMTTLLLSDFEKIKDWKDAMKHLKLLHKQCADIARKWKQSGRHDDVEDVLAEQGDDFANFTHSNWKLLCLHQHHLENGIGAAIAEPPPDDISAASRKRSLQRQTDERETPAVSLMSACIPPASHRSPMCMMSSG